MYNKLGDVHNWSTVGVFENISSSGFNKDFGPLQHPEPGYDFKNNIGTNVQWFNIPDARNDRWLDMEFHYNIDNSIIYAQTFLESESARDVTMLLGVSGSVKLWLNDFQIVSEAEERNTDFDTYIYEVKLQKGVNRILVQLGSSEISRSNFMLRFCDEQGKMITDFKTSASFAPYTKATPYPVKRTPIFAEQYFENKLASGKANLLDKLMLSEIYSHNDKSYENRKITKLLKEEAPKNTIISEALVVAYSQDNNNTDLTREIEFIKTNDPESLIALQYRYNDAINKEDFDDATRLLNRRVELYGSNADTDLKLLNLLGKKKDVENLMKQYETSVKKYPNNVSFVAIDYRMQQDVYKNPKKAMDLLENFLKTNYSEDLMMALANDKMKQNKKQEGFDLLKKMLENKPYATSWYSNMADKYFEVRDYTSSADYLQKAIDLAPYVGTLFL
jgi:tetratricopeptide (TPR) repeat protein